MRSTMARPRSCAQAVGYDVLLLDVMMPGKNGFEVLRALRLTSQLPVLIPN